MSIININFIFNAIFFSGTSVFQEIHPATSEDKIPKFDVKKDARPIFKD